MKRLIFIAFLVWEMFFVCYAQDQEKVDVPSSHPPQTIEDLTQTLIGEEEEIEDVGEIEKLFETENITSWNETRDNYPEFQVYQEFTEELFNNETSLNVGFLDDSPPQIPTPFLSATPKAVKRPGKLCKSRTCRKRSKYLRDPMDFDNYSPCKNFSQFICGKEWTDHLPTYFKSWGFVERVSTNSTISSN